MPTTDPVLSALFENDRRPSPSDREPTKSRRAERRAFARKMHAQLITDPMTSWMHLTFVVWWDYYVSYVRDDPMFKVRPWPSDWPIAPEALLTLREEYWLFYVNFFDAQKPLPNRWDTLATAARATPELRDAFVSRRISHLRVFELGLRADMFDSAANCIGRPLALVLGTGPWTFEHPVYGTYTSDRVAEILARVRCVE